MKKVVLTLIVAMSAMSDLAMARSAGGRCLPSPYTPPTQAQFCHIATRENCSIIGCEWMTLRYRCQPGYHTPASSAPFCAIATAQNCEIIGCEMTPYYAP